MANREQLQVLVVDENPLTRFGILSVINLHPLLHVCEEAADARSARELYSALRPQIVILDIVLPFGDGIGLLKEFAQIQTDCSSVVISHVYDSDTVRRAFQAGAKAYVSKKDEAAELLCAAEAVRSGETYISKIVSAALRIDVSTRICGHMAKLLTVLSDRELHIFRCIGKGLGTTAIARDLGVSVKTIESHQGRIKEKLHLLNSKQLHQAAVSWVSSAAH